MLNSHAKSHTNVYQYRCADCTYASKYCHSLKLHLRRHRHHPAAVLNADGSLPDFEHRGPRTAPPPRRKLFFDDVMDHHGDGVQRAWSAEARVGGATTDAPVTSETAVSDGNHCCWTPLAAQQFPVAPAPVDVTPPFSPRHAAEVTSSSSRDPYAFHDDADCCCPTWRQIDNSDAKRRRLLFPPGSSNNNISDNSNNNNSLAAYDAPPLCQKDSRGAVNGVAAVPRRDDVTLRHHDVTADEERQLPVRKRLRNAEFVARLTANIEAELNAEDRPLDLTRPAAATVYVPSATTDAPNARGNNRLVTVSFTTDKLCLYRVKG